MNITKLYLPIGFKRLLLHTLLLAGCGWFFSTEERHNQIIWAILVGWLFYFWIRFYIRLWRRLWDKPYVLLHHDGLLIHQCNHFSHEHIEWQHILATFIQYDEVKQKNILNIVLLHQNEPVALCIATGSFHLENHQPNFKQSHTILDKWHEIIHHHAFKQHKNAPLSTQATWQVAPMKWTFFPLVGILSYGIGCIAATLLGCGFFVPTLYHTLLEVWQSPSLVKMAIAGFLMVLAVLWFSAILWTSIRLFKIWRGLPYIVLDKEGIYQSDGYMQWESGLAIANIKHIQVARANKLGSALIIDVLPHTNAKVLIRHKLMTLPCYRDDKLHEIVAYFPNIPDEKQYITYPILELVDVSCFKKRTKIE